MQLAISRTNHGQILSKSTDLKIESNLNYDAIITHKTSLPSSSLTSTDISTTLSAINRHLKNKVVARGVFKVILKGKTTDAVAPAEGVAVANTRSLPALADASNIYVQNFMLNENITEFSMQIGSNVIMQDTNRSNQNILRKMQFLSFTDEQKKKNGLYSDRFTEEIFNNICINQLIGGQLATQGNPVVNPPIQNTPIGLQLDQLSNGSFDFSQFTDKKQFLEEQKRRFKFTTTIYQADANYVKGAQLNVFMTRDGLIYKVTKADGSDYVGFMIQELYITPLQGEMIVAPFLSSYSGIERILPCFDGRVGLSLKLQSTNLSGIKIAHPSLLINTSSVSSNSILASCETSLQSLEFELQSYINLQGMQQQNKYMFIENVKRNINTSQVINSLELYSSSYTEQKVEMNFTSSDFITIGRYLVICAYQRGSDFNLYDTSVGNTMMGKTRFFTTKLKSLQILDNQRDVLKNMTDLELRQMTYEVLRHGEFNELMHSAVANPQTVQTYADCLWGFINSKNNGVTGVSAFKSFSENAVQTHCPFYILDMTKLSLQSVGALPFSPFVEYGNKNIYINCTFDVSNDKDGSYTPNTGFQDKSWNNLQCEAFFVVPRKVIVDEAGFNSKDIYINVEEYAREVDKHVNYMNSTKLDSTKSYEYLASGMIGGGILSSALKWIGLGMHSKHSKTESEEKTPVFKKKKLLMN